MSNILEYTLSLQDQMSAKLKSIGIYSDSALNTFVKLEKKTREVNELFGATGRSLGSLKAKLDHLKAEREWIPQSNIKAIRNYNNEIKSLTYQIQRLETVGGTRFANSFRNAFQQIPFIGILTNPFIIAGAIGGQALRLGVEQEMQKTSFEVLLGGKEAADNLMKNIIDYAKKTPYQKINLGDNAKVMLGFGIDEGKIMPMLKTIGDIAMGDANKMGSLTLAFSQMSSTGRLTGQDLLQMINAGFNPLGIISEKSGKSIKVLKEEMERGNISSNMVEDAFRSATSEGGKFHNMADKMSKTLGGKWSNFIDNVSEKFISLYGAIEPLASLMLDLATGGLEAVGNGLSWINTKLKEGNPVMMIITGTIISLAAALTIMKIKSMGVAAWSAIVTFANNVQTASWWQLNAAMFANPITWIIAGVIALIGLIGYLVYKTDGWGEAWRHTISGVKALWGGYVSYLKLSWLVAQEFLLTGIDKIKAGWYLLKSLWDQQGASEGLRRIKEESDARQEAIKKEAKNMAAQGMLAAQEFQTGFNSLSWNKDRKISDFTGGLKEKLGISTPAIPGTKLVGTTLGGNGSRKLNNTATATGGTKHNYITITLGNIVENIHITGKDFKDSANQMEEQVSDALMRLLAMSTTAGN